MSDYTPNLATAREVFIDGAQGEFVGEDLDRMIEAVRAEALRDLEPRDLADLLQGISEELNGISNRDTLRRAAEELKNTARIAAKLGVKTVTGFTGSAIWGRGWRVPKEVIRAALLAAREVRNHEPEARG